MKFYNPSQSGFSLVEVLVAITILLLVIVGPMQIISRSINSTNYASEQVNAWFLAQEGLELAQKGRDDLVLGDFKDQIRSESLEPNPMDTFLTTYAECFNANGCGLIIGNTPSAPISVTACAVNNCRLQLTPSAAADRASYVHAISGNTQTPYTRVIKMERSPAGPAKVREIKVTSTVTWRTGSLISSQKVEAVSYLFNVYDTN